MLFGFERQRKSIELIYNHSLSLSKDIGGFYIGPSGSIIINSNISTPVFSGAFPNKVVCFCLGVGLNSGYNWALNENLVLGISTRFTLLDIGMVRDEVQNPILTLNQRSSTEFEADLIRKQYQLMIAVKIKI